MRPSTSRVSPHFAVLSVMVAVEPLLVVVVVGDASTTAETVLDEAAVAQRRKPNLKGNATAVGWLITTLTRAIS